MASILFDPLRAATMGWQGWDRLYTHCHSVSHHKEPDRSQQIIRHSPTQSTYVQNSESQGVAGVVAVAFLSGMSRVHPQTFGF